MSFMSNVRNSVFGRKRVDDAPAGAHGVGPFAIEISRLDHIKRGWGRIALDYVLTATNPGFLTDLHAVCYRASAYNYPDWCNIEQKNAAHKASNIGLATGLVPPGDVLARFIELRKATCYFVNYSANSNHIGDMVRTLFYSLRSGVYSAYTDNNDVVPLDRLIPTETVLAMIQAVGGTTIDFFEMLFAHDGSEDKFTGQWRRGPAFAALAQSEITAYAAAAGRVGGKSMGLMFDAAASLGIEGQPEILSAMVSILGKGNAKADREYAVRRLSLLDEAPLHRLIATGFETGDVDARHGLVEVAGRHGGATLIELVRARGATERAGKVKAAIDAVLETTQVTVQKAPDGDHPGYPAIDSSFVAIPPAIALAQEPASPASDAECIAFIEIAEKVDGVRATSLATMKDREEWKVKANQPLTQGEIEATFAMLTEGRSLPAEFTYSLTSAIRTRPDGQLWYSSVLDRLPLGVAVRSLLGNCYGDLGKVINSGGWIDRHAQFGVDRINGWLDAGVLGLRELIAMERELKAERTEVRMDGAPPLGPAAYMRPQLTGSTYSYDRNRDNCPMQNLPRDAVWPLIAENLDLLDEAFGLKPCPQPLQFSNMRAMAMLALLPAVPQRYLAKLMDLAVTGKRPEQKRAMALLRPAKDLDERLCALLDDTRQQVRVNAATWLADIRSTASETALRKRLKKEKSDPVRAALIAALQRLGFDLSDVIGPDILIAEAEAAAAKTSPVVPEWLAVSNFPAVRFRDGRTVPQTVLRHWLALAIRLKDPGNCGQFGIYLDQLEPADAQTLSNWLLESWISFDTMASSLEDATAYALANYTGDWRWQYRDKTPDLRDEIVADMTRRKAGELLNSGSDTKGLLALACRADPVWAAARVRWYLKKHGRRSNQAMALLEALAGTGAPAALQVVIAASARLKQKSTQARAAEIAERYAEDRGWTFDELADRTVPSAGFDDDGVLELPCGEDEKLYVARLDAMLAIHLFNPDGKTVKALPAGDDDSTKESNKAFAAAKKELAQVIELQASRLFEAMCVERTWQVADWRLAFHDHPVMRRLIERLVWQGMDDQGHPLGLFRPTQEGDFTDAADNPVDIDQFAKLRLAHGALVDGGVCAAWIAHLKDYEIKPFLAQFDTVRAPLSGEQSEAEAIVDRQGWTSNSLTFRGVAEKRGYERVMRDGGGCNEYVKTFASHGITATIFHTGSHPHDENNRVALKELRFSKAGHRGAFRLSDVPPVMLAECWADYHAVAAKGAFEPEWEKVAPW